MKNKHLKTGSPEKEQAKSSKQPKEQGTRNRYTELFGLGIMILLGIIIYSNSFDCSFHFDDTPNIVERTIIRNLSDINAWWNFNPMNRPLAIYSFALNYHFNQLDVWNWHLVNLTIHLVNSCLIWWLTMLLFAAPALQDTPVGKYKSAIAFFTALLFVSHPLATQSVTYIVQRMASMAAMFYLLSLALYVKARLTENRNWSKYMLFAGSMLSAALAMLTKENAFTLPLAIVLFEIFFLQTKQLPTQLKGARAILLTGVLLCAGVFVLLKSSLSIFNPIQPLHGHTYTVTPITYLFTQFSVIVKYIQLLFLPLNLNLDYDFPISNGFFEGKTILSFLLLSSLVGLAIFLFNRNRIVSFGIFWFFLTLSIESSIIPIEDLIFEHRTYLPSYGFFLILSSGIFVLLWDKFKLLAVSILLVIAGSNSMLTYQRNEVWKNDLTLWNDVVSKSPNKARPFGSRGDVYRDLGQADKAIADYSRAIQINPKYATAYHNRGGVYADLKQWSKALSDYSTAIEMDTKYTKAFYNCGVAYSNLGQWDKAITAYSQTIGIEPDNANAYYGRAVAYTNLRQWDKAVKDYSKMIKYNPKYTDAYYYRAAGYGNLDQWDKAISDYSTVIEIDPKNKNAWYNRGNAFMMMKQWEKAIADFSGAIGVDPNYAPYYINRGVTYGNIGQWDKAIVDYTKAIEIDPKYTNAFSNREIAYRNLKK